MQADVVSKILQQAKQPAVLLVALRTPPDGGDTKHGTTLGEKVEHQQVPGLHGVGHLGTRILRPALNDPDGLGVDPLHGRHHLPPSLGIVDGRIVAALMKGVHRVVVGLAIQTCQLIII